MSCLYCLQVGYPLPAPARLTADRQHHPGLQQEQLPARLQGRQLCAERRLQRRAPSSGIQYPGGNRRCPPRPSLRWGRDVWLPTDLKGSGVSVALPGGPRHLVGIKCCQPSNVQSEV